MITAPSSTLFISYASADQAVAMEVCALLESQGVTCWIAPRDVAPGAKWDEALLRAIDDSSAFLLLLSAASNDSPFVQNEVNRAFARKKPIFTFRIEDVPPSGSLEFYLARHHWTDGFAASIEDTVTRLAESLRSLADVTAPAPGAAATRRVAPALRNRARRERVAWACAVLSLLAAGAVAALHFTEPGPAATPALRMSVEPPPGMQATPAPPSISPDGRAVVMAVTRPPDSQVRLAIRWLEADEARTLPGTEDALLSSGFWSPDSRSVAFVAAGQLKRVDVDSGALRVICEMPSFAGGTWNEAGTILTASGGNGSTIMQVPAGGGTPTAVTKLDVSAGESMHRDPWFLPDGRHFLYTALVPPSDGGDGRVLMVGSLDGGEPVSLFAVRSKGIYASGHLLFMRDTDLLAQPFDATSLMTTGPATVLAQGIAINANGAGAFAASAGGVLVYRASRTLVSELAWVDRSGRSLDVVGPEDDQITPRLSPDGRRLAVSIWDPARRARDIWLLGARPGEQRTRWTFDPADELEAVWSPDGQRLAFSALRGDSVDIFVRPADGSGEPERVVARPGQDYVSDWSPDGRFLLFTTGRSGSSTGNDVYLQPLTGDRTPRPLRNGPGDEANARFSPDGRWVAYQHFEAGRAQVFVAAVDGHATWQVSTDGGAIPVWRRDGRELYFLAPDTLMAAEVASEGDVLQVRGVRALFTVAMRTQADRGFGTATVFDVAPDGRRFLINRLAERAAPPSTRVVINWPATLSRVD